MHSFAFGAHLEHIRSWYWYWYLRVLIELCMVRTNVIFCFILFNNVFKYRRIVWRQRPEEGVCLWAVNSEGHAQR